MINDNQAKIEAHLETHDFSFSIPSTQGNRSLRILLLTPSSLSPSDKAETIYRIERLSSPPGGQDVLIAFLLSENAFTSASRRSNLAPLLDLQALCVHLYISLLFYILTGRNKAK